MSFCVCTYIVSTNAITFLVYLPIYTCIKLHVHLNRFLINIECLYGSLTLFIHLWEK